MASVAEQLAVTNRKPILLLLLIFSLPPALAAAAYFFSSQLALSSKNNGVLLLKPVAVDTLQLTDRQGNPFALDKIHSRWVLIYLSAGPCLNPCKERLWALQQIRKALGKDYPRTQVLLLESSDHQQLQQVVEKMPPIAAAIINKEASTRLAKAVFENQQAALVFGYFLADDKANVIMNYASPLDQQAVYDDLRWLLKVNKTTTR